MTEESLPALPIEEVSLWLLQELGLAPLVWRQKAALVADPHPYTQPRHSSVWGVVVLHHGTLACLAAVCGKAHSGAGTLQRACKQRRSPWIPGDGKFALNSCYLEHQLLPAQLLCCPSRRGGL